ncbi:hypothetical protein [Weissella sagaensis]|uniref:hypothetical protein n=1 Tax=Weissella sagaensis TaxID=2559928 RepID=UPI0013ED6B0E|nr:hypothetical protein [Weissella sagaensis]
MDKQADSQVENEWKLADIEYNGYSNNDIIKFLSQLQNQTHDYFEAKRLLISAIRLVKKKGLTTKKKMTGGYVKDYVDTWIANGLTSVDEMLEFENKRSERSNDSQGESKVLKPTSDQIQKQNEKLAKQLGYNTVEEMGKASWNLLVELRNTRPERMANKPKTGLTATGHQALIRR